MGRPQTPYSRHAKERHFNRPLAVEKNRERVGFLLRNARVREKGHFSLEPCGIGGAITEEIEIDGLAAPEMKRKGRSEVENEFLRQSAKLIPQQALWRGKAIKLRLKT